MSPLPIYELSQMDGPTAVFCIRETLSFCVFATAFKKEHNRRIATARRGNPLSIIYYGPRLSFFLVFVRFGAAAAADQADKRNGHRDSSPPMNGGSGGQSNSRRNSAAGSASPR